MHNRLLVIDQVYRLLRDIFLRDINDVYVLLRFHKLFVKHEEDYEYHHNLILIPKIMPEKTIFSFFEGEFFLPIAKHFGDFQ
jgi:hypothetical protein